MGKSIVSCSWLMATTRLVSACPSCAPRLASCPRSPSCSTAVSQRTSSTETTCGRSAWMRSSRPPRKPSCMTLSCRSLRYRGHFVCDVLWWEAEQVRLKWGLLCLCSENRSATGAGSDGKQKCKSRQIQAATRGHVNNVGREAGIYTQPGVDVWMRSRCSGTSTHHQVSFSQIFKVFKVLLQTTRSIQSVELLETIRKCFIHSFICSLQL